MRTLIRALLRLAPRSFRERYGDELLEVHEARVNEHGGIRRAAFTAREAAGIAALIVSARAKRGISAGSADSPRGEPLLVRIAHDARFALRTLRRNPTFTIAAIVVLALGIGANTAIFSAANALFFRPLPFTDPDRLVTLFETNPDFGWTDASAAPANMLDWRENVAAFDDIAVYSELTPQVTLFQDGEPTLLGLTSVSGNFFDVLGVRASLGRGFRWEETWTGADDVVVLSHALWVSRFGADPAVIGRRLDFGSATAEVVGIMPAGFHFPHDDTEMWTPSGWNEADREAVWFRRAHFVRPVARLAEDVTLEQAAAQLQAEVARLQKAYPETNSVMGAGMAPLRSFLVRGARNTTLVLLGAVALLLLLACVNVANLALVRGAGRTREVALRNALGAGRARIATLFVAESAILALAGGSLGLLLGWLAVRGMDGLARLGINGATGVALDHRVLLFTAAITALSALLFAVAPVLVATRRAPEEQLEDGARGGTRIASHRLAGGLVALEVALAVLLVAGAGLMVRTSMYLRRVDPGFRTDGVLAVQFTVPATRYPERADVLSFYDRLLEAVEGRPGVERAGTVASLPLTGPSWSSQFQAEGWPAERVGFEILHRRADNGYFEALGTPLLRGRLFEPTDIAGGPLVVVVNDAFAREHFPGEDPVGKRIAFDRFSTSESNWYEIVGVVGDQNQVSPAAPARAEVFESRDQDWGRGNWVVIRSSLGSAEMTAVVRDVLSELDPLIPIARVRPLREVWRASIAREELVLTMLAAFGALALILAAVGVYAVTAQAAGRRTREIGIRIALGAMRRDVEGLVLRRGLTAVGVGLVVGLSAALLATRALESLLHGVEPTDPSTLGAVALLMVAVGALACWIPARRATRVDPVRSLRAD